MSDEAKPKEARCFALVDADGIVQSEVFFHRRDAAAEAPDWPECRLVEFVESRALSKAEARAETAEATAKSNARAYDQLEDDLKRAEARVKELEDEVAHHKRCWDSLKLMANAAESRATQLAQQVETLRRLLLSRYAMTSRVTPDDANTTPCFCGLWPHHDRCVVTRAALAATAPKGAPKKEGP